MTTMKTIINAAAYVTGVPAEKLTSRDRSRAYVHIRAAIVHVAHDYRNDERRYGRFSYPRMADVLNRDHSTIIHSRDIWPRECERNPELPALADAIRERIRDSGRFDPFWQKLAQEAEARRLAREAAAERRRIRRRQKLRNRINPPDTSTHFENMRLGSTLLRDAILAVQ